jgi:hypothetical protein
MKLGGMPGDGESQISHAKWKEKEISRIRLCWDELLINPAPRKTRRRILTTGAGVSDRTLKALPNEFLGDAWRRRISNLTWLMEGDRDQENLALLG